MGRGSPITPSPTAPRALAQSHSPSRSPQPRGAEVIPHLGLPPGEEEDSATPILLLPGHRGAGQGPLAKQLVVVASAGEAALRRNSCTGRFKSISAALRSSALAQPPLRTPALPASPPPQPRRPSKRKSCEMFPFKNQTMPTLHQEPLPKVNQDALQSFPHLLKRPPTSSPLVTLRASPHRSQPGAPPS